MKKIFWLISVLLLVVFLSVGVSANEIQRYFNVHTNSFHSVIPDQLSNTNEIQITGVMPYFKDGSWNNHWDFYMRLIVSPTNKDIRHGFEHFNFINLTDEKNNSYTGYAVLDVTKTENYINNDSIHYKIGGFVDLLNKEQIPNSHEYNILGEVRGEILIRIRVNKSNFALIEADILFSPIIDNKKEEIETQLESIKQWLFFWNYDGICNAIQNECLSDNKDDDDNDGIQNNEDVCPNTKLGEEVDAQGCSNPQFCLNQAQCGLDCDLADWKNNEPFSPNPHDCITVIIHQGGEPEPICAGLSCAD